MDVMCFVCVSLGSSTVQVHDSLGSRRACACSEASFCSQMATVLEQCTTEERSSVVRFLLAEGLNARIFIKKCFLFTVGSVCRVKRYTTGSRNSLMDIRKSQMMKRRCGSG
jgi:hypothetical protein